MRKEQYYFRKLLDLWPGLLLVLAISVASLFGSPPPIVRQSIILIVFALNTNVIMNCFGMDTARRVEPLLHSSAPWQGRAARQESRADDDRRGAVGVADPDRCLAIRSVEAGAEIIEAAVLLLSHLTWGNLVSVSAPFKMQFYRFASNGAPLTVLVGMTIGSAPGVMVLFLLHSGSPLAALAIAVILLLVMAAYLVSLHYAGKSLEHRRHIIAERLS